MQAAADEMVTGRWWHKLSADDRIQCDLCPRFCRLKDGDRGFCFVRQNIGGKLILTTYGKSTGFCVDPIEKKPLNHFFPGTSVLSFGTAGCNLGCQFCQNWSMTKSREIEQLSERATPQAIANLAVKSNCKSVAFTYNDPIIWAEYAIDTAKACHDSGIKTVAVTNGYITPVARRDFYAVIDAANVDLKGFTEKFYQRNTLSQLQPVLDTLRWLRRETNVWLEITNLIIPGENDDADEIKAMCTWIVKNLGTDVPLHFSASFPAYRMLDKPVTPPETLKRAREQALKSGIKFVYAGNVLDVEQESTYCPSCHECLIERIGYHVGTYRLKETNRCFTCGELIAGVFSTYKGDWQAQRERVTA